MGVLVFVMESVRLGYVLVMSGCRVELGMLRLLGNSLRRNMACMPALRQMLGRLQVNVWTLVVAVGFTLGSVSRLCLLTGTCLLRLEMTRLVVCYSVSVSWPQLSFRYLLSMLVESVVVSVVTSGKCLS